MCAAQVEGAFVMGIGVLGTEQVDYDSKTGKLIQDSTWTYKIPSATCVPQQLNVAFLKVRFRQRLQQYLQAHQHCCSTARHQVKEVCWSCAFG